MTIFKRAPDFSGELPCPTFPQAAMADDVVQHLTAVDILKTVLYCSVYARERALYDNRSSRRLGKHPKTHSVNSFL